MRITYLLSSSYNPGYDTIYQTLCILIGETLDKLLLLLLFLSSSCISQSPRDGLGLGVGLAWSMASPVVMWRVKQQLFLMLPPGSLQFQVVREWVSEWVNQMTAGVRQGKTLNLTPELIGSVILLQSSHCHGWTYLSHFLNLTWCNKVTGIWGCCEVPPLLAGLP